MIWWELFEVSVNFFQSFMVLYFAHSYLKRKETPFVKKSMLYIVGLTIILSIINHFMLFEHLYAIIYVILIWIYVKSNFRGTVFQISFACVFPVLVILISTAFVGNLATIILKTNMQDLLSNNDYERFITIALLQLVILYILMVSIKIFRKNANHKSELTKVEGMFITVVLILSIIICGFLNLISLENISHISRMYLVVIFLCIVLINVFVCYIIVNLDNKNKVIIENEVHKLEQEYTKSYIESVDSEYVNITKLRHDFKDNYSIIYNLISNNNIENALKHIEDNINQINQTDVLVNTNNKIVNAIINIKLGKAKSQGIDVVCLSTNNFIGVEDIDLARLLSNMLENAITACMLANNKQHIYLKIIDDGYRYIFNLKNTVNNSILNNNPELVTTKQDKANHGYGISIMKDIANKYNGNCDFYEVDNYFYCTVTLIYNYDCVEIE